MKVQDMKASDYLVVAFVATLIFGAVLHVFFDLGAIASGIGDILGSPNAAGWAQAIGTFLAVLVTGGMAWWESRQRRFEARARGMNAARVRIAALSYLPNALFFYIDFSRQPWTDADRNDLVPRVAASTRTSIGLALEVRAHEMPTVKSARILNDLHLAAHRMLGFMDHYGIFMPDESGIRDMIRTAKSIESQLRYIKREIEQADY